MVVVVVVVLLLSLSSLFFVVVVVVVVVFGHRFAPVLALGGGCLTQVALMSAHVAHILADVGPMLAQACPYRSLMLTHVAHILADVGPMLAPRPSRCPAFRSGPRPKTQNHEKPMVFASSPVEGADCPG